MPTVPRDRRAGPLDREQQRRQSRAAVLDRVRSGQCEPRRQRQPDPIDFYAQVARQAAQVYNVPNATVQVYHQGAPLTTATGGTYTWDGAFSGSGFYEPIVTTGTVYFGTPVNAYTYAPTYAPQPQPIRLTAAISHDAVARASDPNVPVAEVFNELRRAIERRIMEEHNLPIEDVWRRWSAEIIAARDPVSHETTIAVTASQRSAATDDTWNGWAQGVERFFGPAASTSPRPTAADLRRSVERERRERMVRYNRGRARSLRLRVAERRARELLVAVLDPVQRADFEAEQGFRVIVGDRRYWIAHGYAGNICRVDDRGAKLDNYCVHGPSHLPTFDHMLAQKLLLETDEEGFLSLANRTAPYTGTVVERLVPDPPRISLAIAPGIDFGLRGRVHTVVQGLTG